MPGTRQSESRNRREIGKWVAWLVAVRRAELSREESAAYLGGLVDLPAWAVERACRYLGSQPRGEYEPAMPDLGAIRVRA